MSLANWENNLKTLSPLYVPRNGHFIYMVEERIQLEKLPVATYMWDRTA
jgi:hypothetical protein